MRGPRSSAKTFDVIVVDHRINSTTSRNEATSGKSSFVAACVRQSKRQTVRSWGVVSTLTETISPPPVNKPSVSVPPTSMSAVHTSRLSPSLTESHAQLFRFHTPAEKGLDVEHGGIVNGLSASGHCGVGHKDGPVIVKISVTKR